MTPDNRIKRGDRLPNGAFVIDVKDRAKDEAVVLCLSRGEYVTCLSRGEYVTWIANPNYPDSTCWGNYFGDQLGAAYDDFQARANVWREA